MSENGLKTEFYAAEVQENACKLYRPAVALTSHAIERRIARVQVARRQYPERVGRWNRWLRHRPNYDSTKVSFAYFGFYSGATLEKTKAPILHYQGR